MRLLGSEPFFRPSVSSHCLTASVPVGDKLVLFNIAKYRLDVLTYLLTPWSRVLLEKLTGFAASQEIPRIFGTRRFLTVLTSARHLSLSWVKSIQSPQPPPPTSCRSILILSSHLRLGLPNGLFPQISPPEPCAHYSKWKLRVERYVEFEKHLGYSLSVIFFTCLGIHIRLLDWQLEVCSVYNTSWRPSVCNVCWSFT